VGVGVPQQRLPFHDDTSLYLEIVVDADLEPMKYSFHFQEDDGTRAARFISQIPSLG
jgi:hypothetical protein